LSKTPGSTKQPNKERSWGAVSPWKYPLSSANPDPPLAGISVLDFTQVIAGPALTRTLAELGARVVRVENPDLSVAWVEPFHIAYNPGKETQFANLKSTVGKQQLESLMASVKPDIVVDNFRPGVMQRLGLAPEDLTQNNPSVISASVSAYGPGGPWTNRPGWEQTAQAAVGIQATWGSLEAPELFPVPVNDFSTGLSGAFGVLLALLHRKRSGEGQHVQTSLAGSAVHLFSHGPSDPLRSLYKARDGWCALAATPGSLNGVAGITQPVEGLELLADLAKAPTSTWAERLDGRAAGVVAWRTSGKALRMASKDVVITEHIPGVGNVARTAPALNLSRTPLTELEPAAPRGGVPLDPARQRSWLGWIWELVRWAIYRKTGR